MTELRYGIVGCGRIGKRHLQILNEMPGAKVVAICDADPDKREAFRLREPGALAFANLAEMLDRADLDVVVICSPTHLHADMVTVACAAGKHVYCEKAMAASPAQCKAMITAADRAGVKLTIGQSTRFQPPSMMARRLVEAGTVGDAFAVSGAFSSIAEPVSRGATDSWRYRQGSAGNGHVINFGCHYIDTARFVLGQDPINVAAVVRNILSRELISEDQFLTHSEGEAGGLIRIDLFSNFAGTKSSAEGYTVIGTQGRIEFPAYGKVLRVVHGNGEPKTVTVDADLAEYDGFQRLHRLFRDAVVKDAPTPLDGQTAALNLEWGLAVYISSDQRRTVELPLADEFVEFVGPVVSHTIPATREG